jgi:hypothetical protein
MLSKSIYLSKIEDTQVKVKVSRFSHCEKLILAMRKKL